MADRWTSGELYEPYVGRWSRLVAREFVGWLDQPPGFEWLDVGSGTGALTQSVLDLAAPKRVVGVEPSEGFVDHARAHVPDATFHVGTATETGQPDDAYAVVVSGLVLNFVADQPGALTEMSRVVRPSGTIAAYVWDYAGGMQLMRHFWDAALELFDAATSADEATRFPVCSPDGLTELWTTSGLTEVRTTAIDVPTVFRDFDDYWTPFLSGQAPAPAFAMSLSEDDRERLRERIRARLPIADDGTIALTARAWAVRGRLR